MSSPFMAEVLAATAAVDAAFAKPFQLLPRVKPTDPNAPVVPDTSRASVTFNAIHVAPKAKPLIANAYDPRADQRPGTSSSHPLIKISPAVQSSFTPVLVVQSQDILVDVETSIRWRVSSARTTPFGIRECVVELVS